jgi:hypothetical protein
MWFRGLTLLAGLVLLGACGTIDEMPPQTAANHQEPKEFASFYSAEPPARDPDVPPPAPRLRQTKTLGESYDTPYMSHAGQAALYGSAHSVVIINNNIPAAGPQVVYSGSGYAPPCYCGGSFYGPGGVVSRGTGGGSTGSTGSTSGGHVAPSNPGVGGSWPSVPSHGPITNR